MKQMVLVFSFLCATIIHAQIDPALENALQQILNTHNQNTGSIGLSASVILPNDEVWNGVAGFSNPQSNELMEENMQLCFASITKTFVATQILWMEEHGALSIDDVIGEYLSPMTNVNSLITIRQLLNHTSGVYNYTNAPNLAALLNNNLSYNWSHLEIIETFVDAPVFSPGDNWSYSNTNYILLAMLIETIQNDPWGHQVNLNFLDPLGLDEIQLPIEEPLNGPVAVPWMDLDGIGGLDNGSVISVDSAYASMRCAAGGLYSTAEQMASWGKRLYEGEILSETQMQKMLDFIALPNIAGWDGYGLGTQHFTLPDGKNMYGHNGGVHGYLSALRYSPECEISVSVVSNENASNPHAIAIELMLEACDFITTGIEEVQNHDLSVQIFPNPITIESIITYQLFEPASIEIIIIDALGRIVRLYNEGEKPAGTYSRSLNEVGELASGVYSVLTRTDRGSMLSKVISIK